MTNEAGIYMIKNIVNRKCYIGSASILRKRRDLHFFQLNKNIHPNTHLQNAWNKYSANCFEFIVLQILDKKKEVLISIEQKWIDWYNPEYNLCRIAGSQLGIKRSQETKLKMKHNRKHNEETKLKISLANKGRKLSEITKEKHKIRMQGNSHTKGMKFSKEHSIMKSIALKGINRKSNKWPCEAGSLCKCGSCKLLRKKYYQRNIDTQSLTILVH